MFSRLEIRAVPVKGKRTLTKVWWVTAFCSTRMGAVIRIFKRAFDQCQEKLGMQSKSVDITKATVP